MAEWSKAMVLKTIEGATSPRVRIPISPPLKTEISSEEFISVFYYNLILITLSFIFFDNLSILIII